MTAGETTAYIVLVCSLMFILGVLAGKALL